jgi:hypothetical protein
MRRVDKDLHLMSSRMLRLLWSMLVGGSETVMSVCCVEENGRARSNSY